MFFFYIGLRVCVCMCVFDLCGQVGLTLLTLRRLRHGEDGYQPADRQEGYGGTAEPYQEPNPSSDY